MHPQFKVRPNLQTRLFTPAALRRLEASKAWLMQQYHNLHLTNLFSTIANVNITASTKLLLRVMPRRRRRSPGDDSQTEAERPGPRTQPASPFYASSASDSDSDSNETPCARRQKTRKRRRRPSTFFADRPTIEALLVTIHAGPAVASASTLASEDWEDMVRGYMQGEG